MSNPAFEAIDTCFKDLKGFDATPFTGQAFVFDGDFRQALPIVHADDPTAPLDYCVLYSDLWQFPTMVISNIPYVREGQQQFSEFLLNL